VTTPGTTYLALFYRNSSAATGITPQLQSSPDLQNWTTVVTPDIDQPAGTDTLTGDPIQEMGVKLGSNTKLFLRLAVPNP
jgi:hypothetical protein